jgi:ribosomal protein S18 acetylase RimI-like enzyme
MRKRRDSHDQHRRAASSPKMTPGSILHDIIVEPARRGRGVGRLLLEATLACLKSRDAPRVVLSTAERNGPAQRLFASLGFRRTMVEMTRELDGAKLTR